MTRRGGGVTPTSARSRGVTAARGGAEASRTSAMIAIDQPRHGSILFRSRSNTGRAEWFQESAAPDRLIQTVGAPRSSYGAIASVAFMLG